MSPEFERRFLVLFDAVLEMAGEDAYTDASALALRLGVSEAEATAMLESFEEMGAAVRKPAAKAAGNCARRQDVFFFPAFHD